MRMPMPLSRCPACDDVDDENDALREKVARLENHIIGQDKIIEELKQQVPVRSASKEIK